MEKRDERLENETYRNEILSRMRTFSTPELCDGAGLYHAMDYHIKPRVAGKKIVGTAVTVDVPMGEGGIISDAILMLKPGGCACDRRKRLSCLFLLGRPQKHLRNHDWGRGRRDRRSLPGFGRM